MGIVLVWIHTRENKGMEEGSFSFILSAVCNLTRERGNWTLFAIRHRQSLVWHRNHWHVHIPRVESIPGVSQIVVIFSIFYRFFFFIIGGIKKYMSVDMPNKWLSNSDFNL